MKITRRMEWPEPRDLTTLEELSQYSLLLYQTLTEESALRAVELDVAYTDGYNVFLGHEAGQSNTISLDDTEGIYNVFIGHQAGYSNTTGIKNIAIGYSPLYTNTTGGENTALGSEALYSNTTGANNVALGNDALYTNSTGNYNVAVGFEALKVSTVSNNVAVGYQALVANTSGAENVGVGYKALNANTTASYNVAIGMEALLSNTVTTSNVAIGYRALKDFNRTPAVATENVAIGRYAMTLATTGIHNVAVGGGTLGGIVTGDKNVAVGENAMASVTGGNDNVAVGSHAGQGLTTGADNTAIGKDALYTNSAGAGNVILGYQAGYNETGSNKLYIANSNTATPLIGGVFPNTSLTFTSTNSSFSGTLMVGTPNVSETLLGASANTAGHEGVSLHHDGTEAWLVSVDSGTAWHDLTIQASNVRFDLGGVADAVVMDSSGNVFIGDTANAKMTKGLTINQSTNDDEILALKSTTDVAHGCTTEAETDTYMRIKKVGATDGGARVGSYTDAQISVYWEAVYAVDNTTKTASAYAPFTIYVPKISGTGLAANGADANLFCIRAYDGCRFIVDEDGDALADGAHGTYQDHDDIALVNELEDILSDKIDKKEMKKKDVFKKHKIVDVSEGIDEDGKPFFSRFVSTKRKNMLLYGACRQMNQKIEALEKRLKDANI